MIINKALLALAMGLALAACQQQAEDQPDDTEPQADAEPEQGT